MNRNLKPVIGDFYLRRVFEANAEPLGRRCGETICAVLIDKLTNLIGLPSDDRYNYLWRRAIEPHSQDFRKYDLDVILVDALRDVSFFYVDEERHKALSLVTSLLESGYQTLSRIGIHICRQKFEIAGHLFWRHFNPRWFLEPGYWHEVYWYLRDCLARFSPEQRQQLLEAIQKVWVSGADEGESEKYTNQQKRDLLNAVHGLGDPEIDRLYERYVEIAGAPSEHPDFRSYSHGVSWGHGRSPITADKILSLPVQQLVALLQTFESEKGWEAPSVEGLSDALAQAIKADPAYFSGLLHLFVEVPRIYQHALIRAFETLWREGREIAWRPLLSFIEILLTQPQLTDEIENQANNSLEAYGRSTVYAIADLIEAGVKDDEHSFDTSLLDMAQAILKAILASVPGEKFDSSNVDCVNTAMNSLRGQTLQSFINLALRRCRLADQTVGSHHETWLCLVDTFDDELAKSTEGRSYEFSVIASMYAPNLYYMGSDWVLRNFERIFFSGKDDVWRCAAEGFSYVGNFFKWLYEYLNRNGHLERMVFDDSLSDHVMEKATQYAVVGYLNDGESEGAESTVIDAVIEGLHVKQIKLICWFLWTMREDTPIEAHRTRIIEFWRRVSARLTTTPVNSAEIRSALNLLAPYLRMSDADAVTLWSQAAPFADHSHHGYVLVRELASRARTHPSEVGRVFLSALEGFVPDHDQTDIIDCVRLVFEANEGDAAEQICALYSKHGHSFLRPLYDEYRMKLVRR